MKEQKKKKDNYTTAICPECGRFMKKVSETDWECCNAKHKAVAKTAKTTKKKGCSCSDNT